MGLQSLDFPVAMNTSEYNVSNDFFTPALQNSMRYDRGVGFFSSGWLRQVIEGMAQFAENGGQARIITSPILNADDWEALQQGAAAHHDKVLYKSLEETIDNLRTTLARDVRAALSWLIADGILTFKLAVPQNDLAGEFHAKFGIFTDADGDKVSFNGSNNETVNGTLHNYETFNIFCSWKEAYTPIVNDDVNRFERLWNNIDPNLRVYNLPEAARHEIIKIREKDDKRPYKKPKTLSFIISSPQPSIPSHISLRDYQLEAIDNWFNAGCRGLFEMATGTGKTITALGLTTRLYEKKKRLALIITVPYQHLVDQWYDESRSFGYMPIRAYKARTTWLDEFNNRILSYNHKDNDVLCVITTHTTFSTEHFQNTIARISDNALLVADEVHHLGAETRRNYFPENINLRLALSATPDRWFDDEGTMALRDYFGTTVFELSLAEAIGKSLTNYYYYPHLVELTVHEMEEYKALSVKIGQLLAQDRSDDEQLTRLLLKRANLLNSAQNKISVISELVDKQSTIKHTLFYCSPGQIDEVVRLLGWEKRLQVHRFTAREDIPTRQTLLSKFGKGELDALVAMHCLDEGVDVPNTRTAYILASSSNPRQFIQRRGRVLRKAPGKDHAIIHDLITVPPPPSELSESGVRAEQSILKRELRRFAEFADSALNTQAAYEVIWELAKQFDVLDF
jgi:superfamily II DNA or RNA helicase